VSREQREWWKGFLEATIELLREPVQLALIIVAVMAASLVIGLLGWTDWVTQLSNALSLIGLGMFLRYLLSQSKRGKD
jgi:hypothetical protein